MWDPVESLDPMERFPRNLTWGSPWFRGHYHQLGTVPGLEWDQPASEHDAAELPRVPDMVLVLAGGGQTITGRVHQDKHNQISQHWEQT